MSPKTQTGILDVGEEGGSWAKNNWRRIDCVYVNTRMHMRGHTHTERAHTHIGRNLVADFGAGTNVCHRITRARARQMRPVFGWKLDAENRH